MSPFRKKKTAPAAPSTSSMLPADAVKLEVRPVRLVEGMSLVTDEKQRVTVVHPNRAERRRRARGRAFRRVQVPPLGTAVLDDEGNVVMTYHERSTARANARVAKAEARQNRPVAAPSDLVPASRADLRAKRIELRRAGVLA